MSIATTTLSNAIRLGKDCVLTVGGETLAGVSSVSITCEADEVDVSTRDDNGYAKSLPGKKTITLSVEFKRIISDAGQNVLYTAYAGTNLGLACVTQYGAAAITGTFVVTSLEETQDMDDAVTVSATLKNYGACTVAGETSTPSVGGST